MKAYWDEERQKLVFDLEGETVVITGQLPEKGINHPDHLEIRGGIFLCGEKQNNFEEPPDLYDLEHPCEIKP